MKTQKNKMVTRTVDVVATASIELEITAKISVDVEVEVDPEEDIGDYEDKFYEAAEETAQKLLARKGLEYADWKMPDGSTVIEEMLDQVTHRDVEFNKPDEE